MIFDGKMEYVHCQLNLDVLYCYCYIKWRENSTDTFGVLFFIDYV